MVITIKLPSGAEVLVKANQRIDFKTPLAKNKIEKAFLIPLAKIMNIAPSEIFISLKKVIGERIEKGELLAEKKSLLNKKRYLSEQTGQLKEIDHDRGNILISVNEEADEFIDAFFKGDVVAVKKNHLEVKLPPGHKFDTIGAMQDFGGQVVLLSPDSISSIGEDAICEKIVMVEKIQDYQQAKLEALQAKGLISLQELSQTPTLPHAQIKNESDWKKILELALPYCIVDRETAIIYFYSD